MISAVLNKEFHFRQYLYLFLGALLLPIILGFSIWGPSILFNHTTFFHVCIMSSMLFLSLHFSNEGTFPVVAILTLELVLYYFIRLVCYLWIPDDLYIPYGVAVNVGDVNECLEYINLAIFFLMSGLFLFSWIYTRRIRPRFSQGAFRIKGFFLKNHISNKALLLVYLIALALEFYLTNFLKIVPANARHFGTYHTLLMGLRTSVNIDSCFFFVFSILFYNYYRYKTGRNYLLFVLLTYWFSTIMAGAKSGILRVDTVLLCFFITCFPRDKIKFKSMVLICLGTVILGPLSFYLCQSVRMTQINSQSLTENISKLQEEFFDKGKRLKEKSALMMARYNRVEGIKATAGPMGVILPEAVPINGQLNAELTKALPAGWAGLHGSSFWQAFVAPNLRYVLLILDRLGIMDYAILAVVKLKNVARVQHYFSMSYLFKSIANMVLPGTPYKEAELRTSRTMLIFFGQGDEESALLRFNSEPWTAWGAAILHFGLLGGLAFLFLAMGGLFMALRLTIDFFPSFPYVYAALFLWVGIWGFFANFGLDNLAAILVFMGVQFLLLDMLARFIDFILSKMSIRDPSLA